MTRPHSPARAHYERAAAEQRQTAETPATRADANAYELMLVKLAEDRRRLHELQSIERKIELKRTLLPEYAPWVEGALSGARGVQDDVIMTVMVWRIDVGDLAGALEIARYALDHGLVMPDKYKRSTGCLIAEEFADYALRHKADPGEQNATSELGNLVGLLMEAGTITAESDMPDEVRAKLFKAVGYQLAARESVDDKRKGLECLQRALSLHDKVGVKKDIERLERDIKNLAPPPGTSGDGG